MSEGAGVHFSSRLHPSDDYEYKAIQVLKRLQDKGFKKRQILTDALLRLDGMTPEMFEHGRQIRQDTQYILDNIEGMFDELWQGMNELLNDVRVNGTEVIQQLHNEVTDEGTEDGTYARNMVAAYQRRKAEGQP